MTEMNDVNHPRCAASITTGMLTRWFYDQDPGGGITREALSEHLVHCSVCSAEIREISERDEILQEKFETDLVANAALIGVLRQHPIARVENAIRAGTETNDDAVSEAATDLVAILASNDLAGKARVIVRSLQKRLAEPDGARREELVYELSTLVKGILEVNKADFMTAMKAKASRRMNYPVADKETLPLIVQLLSDPESHLHALQPIIRLDGEQVAINWAAWDETTSHVGY